jgi:hypothetical protein
MPDLAPQSLPLDSNIGPQITVDLRSLDEESFKKTMEEQATLGWPDVTDQEKVFVVRYLVDFNHKKAAEESGIDPDKALRVLRDPLINAYTKWLRRGLEARELLTREMVAHHWLEALPKLRGEEEIPLVTKDGQQTKGKKYHASEYVRALVELSRITNLTPEEIHQSKPSVQVNLNFGGMLAPGQSLPMIEVVADK